MTNYYIAILLLLLAVGAVVVRKTYYYLPFRELKRRAEHHDPLASKLYPTVSYTNSLRGLLLGFIILTSAGGVVLLSKEAPAWIAVVAVVLLLWAVYSWLPASRTTSVGVWLTTLVNPFVLWLVGHMHRILDRPTKAAEKRLSFEQHTGLYERDDWIHLIQKQQHQADSRFSEEELEIAKRALSFGDYTVSDVLTPKKAVKTVLADDTVGPVLIDELHKSKQNYILVRETAKGEFVGTLNYRLLGLHSSGKVKDYLNPAIYYIHEDDDLNQALHTFFVTNRPLFIVVDNAEEYIGIVTIDSILRQLLGHIPGEDETAEQHASPAAVVARHKKARKHAESEDDVVEFDDDEAEPADHQNDKAVDSKDANPEDTSVKPDEKMVE